MMLWPYLGNTVNHNLSFGCNAFLLQQIVFIPSPSISALLPLGPLFHVQDFVTKSGPLCPDEAAQVWF